MQVLPWGPHVGSRAALFFEAHCRQKTLPSKEEDSVTGFGCGLWF